MNDFKNSDEIIMAPRAEDFFKGNKLTLAWFKSVVACKGNINDTGPYSKKNSDLNSHKGQG